MKAVVRQGEVASRTERVVIMAPVGRTATLAARMMRDAGVESIICRSADTLASFLASGAGVLLLIDEALTREAADVLRAYIDAQPSWSDLPVVVCSGRHRGPGPGQAVEEVLGPRSNVTVLERPVRAHELISVVRSGLRARRRQYDVRELVAHQEDVNRILEEQVAAQTAELKVTSGRLKQLITECQRLERETLAVSTEEREWFAQELHDGLCQQLSSLSFMIALLRDQLGDEASAVERFDRITALANRTIREARGLAHGLFPIELGGDGLSCALKELADRTEAAYEVSCSVNVSSGTTIDDESVAIHLYRITQEAISNAVRHGKARHIDVSLDDRRELTLRIEDDGRGIGQQPVSSTRTGIGLKTMRRRARRIGAVLDIRARPQGGTAVVCRLGSAGRGKSAGHLPDGSGASV